MNNLSVHIQLFFLTFSFIGAWCGKLNLQPKESQISKYVGEELAVTCSENPPSNSSLNWRKGRDMNIRSTERWQRVYQARRDFGNILILGNIERSDSGHYFCHASGNKEEEEVNFELIVLESMAFKDTSLIQNGSAGDPALMVRCEAIGTPMPVIKWSKEGQKLDPSRFEEMGDGLVIHNPVPEDAGNYTCMAIQENSIVKTIIIRVNVFHKPNWIEHPVKHIVYRGKGRSATLSCKTNGFPKPTVRWFFKEDELSIQTDEIVVSELGNYRCNVSNYLGFISRNITVKEGLPGRPGKAKVHNMTMNTVSLDLTTPTPSIHQNIIGYNAEVLDKQRKLHSQLKFSSGPPFLIENLSPDTTYIIRLRAETEVGLGDYSLEVIAKTSNAACVSMISLIIIVCPLLQVIVLF